MNTVYDVLIIGGGPAGLSTAYLCHKHGLSYLVLESGKAIFQGIANTYPEGKLVYASKPKDAPEPFMVDELRPPDKPVTVESYLQYVQHFVQHENLNVQTEVAFEDIKDERDGLTVITSKGNFKGKKVVLSFGSNIPRELSVYGDAKMVAKNVDDASKYIAVSYTHLRAHETRHDLVCRLLLEK